MANHKKLADEAYANDYVIHQNAYADRKLQKELDQLERLRIKQRRRLEQEEHYFTVLHRVVPVFQPGDDANSRTCGFKSKPGLRKRLTEPVIGSKKESVSSPLKCESAKELMSPRLRRELLNLRDIAFDAPKRNKSHEKQSLDNVGAHYKHYGVPDSHAKDARTNDESQQNGRAHFDGKQLVVTGSRMSERRQHPSQRSAYHADKGIVSGHTKCVQYLNDNENYLQDVDSMSLKSITSEDENAEEHATDSGKLSVTSNKTEFSSASDSVEKLPNIDKVGLRVMGANPSKQEMKMLYQLKEGHLDVPKTGVANNTHCTFGTDDGLTTFEKLTLRGNLRKSQSLDSRPVHNPFELTQSDHPLINGTHMTLVKFLPKSMQALYLK